MFGITFSDFATGAFFLNAYGVELLVGLYHIVRAQSDNRREEKATISIFKIRIRDVSNG